MDYAELIAHFRRPSDAAKALEVDRRLVDAWKQRRIPSKHQLKAEHVTAGALKADDEARAEAQEILGYVAGQEARL